VYGITRRGYGASSAPAGGYGADRLGDDVIAVLDALKLEKPVLVGHSIGGEELSSVGSRHPDRVAALIYLDAAYAYAFNNGSSAVPPSAQKFPPMPPLPKPADADLKSFAAYRAWDGRVMGTPMPESELHQIFLSGPHGEVGPPRVSPGVPLAIMGGSQKYTEIRVPVLAIFAVPHDLGPWVRNYPEVDRAFSETDAATVAQVDAFEKGVPTARVFRLPHAHHYVFMSNEADVLREMRAFLKDLDNLPNPFLKK
jgi:pimeloyl-ACP methyl ester carboxylesterase